ncbi:unnamed protein product [Rotaria sordida]|uniref:RCC1-like domain-containing protein n=1 Tax=Rotaria sordida TaxID=392033 RepID=A0A819JID8_9BILA|nr:unnamed protein product [Rotaria sordida]CAF3931116.1 unnamed protein product [Rotaria sordida]
MANNENDNDAPQVYLLGKTYLANNQGQFYIRNDPIVHMAAGDRHTIIVTGSGRAFAFGDNGSGQLGLGHTNNVEKVSCIKSLKFGDTGEKVILAACGRESSLVATNHGALYGFGSNSRSQLGIQSSDSNTIYREPVKIEYFKGKIVWKQIAMGAEHSCALNDEGMVYVWGSNDDGQCAQPRKTDVVQMPRELRVEYEINAISCGYYHTALVSTNGRLLLFGNNDDRQLGRSMSDKFSGPIEVSIPNKVKAVACGNQHTVVLTENGEVYTCGLGDRGQLGLGPRVLSADTFENVQGLSKRLTTIAAGEGHTVVLTVRGDMYVFGDGKHGKLGSQIHSNEFEPCLVDKFKTYNVLKVVCGGCQTIILAQKKTSERKQSSGSEGDIGNTTLSITQRPKSQARNTRIKTIAGRSHTVGDSTDTTLHHVRPLGAANHLRVESDDDKSDKELSASLKSATFNQTHTITNGKFLPTQSPSLNRTSFRSNDSDLKPLKTGALDHTVRLSKDLDDSIKTNNRFSSSDKSPIRNTRFDRTSPQPLKKKQDSDEDKSSSDEPKKPFTKKPERLSPPIRNDRKTSPIARRRDDSESDDNKFKRPSPIKTPISETLNRKPRSRHRSDEEEEEEEEEKEEEEDEDEDEEDKNRPSNRRNKQQPPPTVARRSSLPPQTRSGVPTSSTRDGNQTIGARPVDGVRGSFRSQATKTLAKPNTTTTNTDTTKKETPPAQQPGFFARIFGSKSTPTSSPPASQPAKTPAVVTNSRTCSIM